MNNLKKSGVFDCTGASGNPFGNNATCIVVSTYVKSNLLVQRAYRNNRVKMRWLWDSSSQGDWTDWTDIYGSYMLNNSELLSPLASALGGTYDFYIVKNETATLGSGIYIIGSAYLGFCVVSSSSNGGIVEVGGVSLSSIAVSTSGQTITYGDGVGSSRVVKKLLGIL